MRNTQDEKIIRKRTTLGRTGLSNTMLYELVRKGEFPQPILLGARAVGWLDSEVSQWIAERVEKSRAPQENAKRT